MLPPFEKSLVIGFVIAIECVVRLLVVACPTQYRLVIAFVDGLAYLSKGLAPVLGQVLLDVSLLVPSLLCDLTSVFQLHVNSFDMVLSTNPLELPFNCSLGFFVEIVNELDAFAVHLVYRLLIPLVSRMAQNLLGLSSDL